VKQIGSPVVILGARSDIGRALARAYAAEGCAIVLAARRARELQADMDDLGVRYGVQVSAAEFDVTSPDADKFFDDLPESPGTVILVAGLLGDHSKALADDREAARVLDTNFSGPARWLLAAARTMTAGGTIIGISSVAGDRGRASNFIYGSAKAGLTAFLSGLRGSLMRRGIHVMTVKPGFVDTRMTEGMSTPRLLTAKPDEVAYAMLAAQRRRQDVLYVQPVWRPIMAAIRAIPERLFKRLPL
jgi:short-subunit dehydrogenase